MVWGSTTALSSLTHTSEERWGNHVSAVGLKGCTLGPFSLTLLASEHLTALVVPEQGTECSTTH